MVNLGNEKVIRCLNCWKLYPNSKSILEHWIHGRCLFYCSICGKSFHDNIKLIRDHFPDVHGIKYRIPERTVKVNVKDLNNQNVETNQKVKKIGIKDLKNHETKKTQEPKKEEKKKLSKTTCAICSLTFSNLHARNSHMRCHKTFSYKPSPGSSPTTSVGSTSSNDSKKRQSDDFRAPKKPVSKKSTATKHIVTPTSATKSLLEPPASRKPLASRKTPAPTSTPTHKVKSERNEDACFTNIPQMIVNDMHTVQYVNHSYSATTTDGEAPRLQVKSLYELQDPSHDPMKEAMHMEPRMSVCEPYYGQQNCYPPMMSEPMDNYMNHPMRPTSSAAQPHMLQPLAPVQPPPQFQISQAQQVQNTQYYNPVFVVQQPQHGGIVNLPPDPNVYHQPQQAYGGSNDYGHYYT